MNTFKTASLTFAALLISGAAIANAAGQSSRASHSPDDKAYQMQQTENYGAPMQRGLPMQYGDVETTSSLNGFGEEATRSIPGNLNGPNADFLVGGGHNADGPTTGSGDSNATSGR